MTREVAFRATCCDTRFGWHLRVVGNCRALGHWDPRGGVRLSTTAADFPVWRSAGAVGLKEDAAIEYKYVICDGHGRIVRWEGATNRSLCLALAVARGLCAQLGVITIVEGFNVRLGPEQARFCYQPQGGAASARHSVGSRRIQEWPGTPAGKQEAGTDTGHFEPTMRERCASMAFLPSSRRSMSLSGAVPPEVTSSAVEDVAIGDDDGDGTTDSTGLVREESSSHLFSDAPEEQPPEEMEISKAFEQQYSLVGTGPLGEGTFGLLWRCQVNASGAERAAKIVRKSRLDEREREFLLGVDGEISTHLNLKHPHIVELFEFFEEQHNVTLVLEFCPGGDLFDVIVQQWEASHRGLPERQAATATKHVLLALAYLHDVHWVVHRDIKCENILISKVGVPLGQNVFKLCDFGFATHDRGGGLTERLGSPDTVAPEVVNGLRYSFPADLWSVGTVVYMMLAATSPFKATTDMEVMRKVATANYSLSAPIWDGISAPAKHVVTSLMTVDSRLRPTAEEALRKAWLKHAPAAAATH